MAQDSGGGMDRATISVVSAGVGGLVVTTATAALLAPLPIAFALGGTAAVIIVAATWLATSSRPASARADTRWTALLSSTSVQTRETLAAVERLTDPLAIERRVTEAMRDVAPSATLELLRAPHGPRGIMSGAREVDPARLVEAVRTNVLKTDDGLLLPVRYGAEVFGALSVTGPIRGSAVLQLRRFADLLAFRLELHRMYAELAHSQQLAALGTFAAALGHDLRTPLASISMALQGLELRRDALGDDAELVDIGNEQVQRLLELIGDILDFSRPVTIDATPVDVRAVIAESVRRHRARAEARQVGVRPELGADLPPVAGDATRLQRVVDNLLSNAIAFSPRGADVRVRAVGAPQQLAIEVIDRGPGIDEDDQAKLFEPFFSKREGGTGLGLAIVDRIVQAHGGRITVDSAKGRGTKMTVRLPVRTAARSG